MAKKKSELPSQENTEQEFKCSICNDMVPKEMFGHGLGNNPEPIYGVEDRCCDFCNCMFVLPARMGVHFDYGDLENMASILKRYDVANLLKWWSVFYTSVTKPELASSRHPKQDQQ